MRKGCLGVLALLLLACGGLWAWTQLSGPRLDRRPLAKLPVQEQQKRRVEARALEDQVRDIGRSAQAHEKKPFELEVTDQQLNTLLQDRLDTSKFPIRNLAVGFEPGRVVAQGDVKYNGFEATATLEGTVELRGGQLVYETDSLQIGGLPAPKKWKSQLDSQVTEQLNRALSRAPGRVESVRIEAGKMIVSGQTD